MKNNAAIEITEIKRMSIWQRLVNFLRWFMSSRKALLALVGWIVACVLVIRGMITIEQFIDATLTLTGILIAGIAFEDAAMKYGLTQLPGRDE